MNHDDLESMIAAREVRRQQFMEKVDRTLEQGRLSGAPAKRKQPLGQRAANVAAIVIIAALVITFLFACAWAIVFMARTIV